ncbi:sugar phosphate isomerase/epimerase family protein [Paenibacillus oceani]|uniref:Sugar phosphate isomerase/epimerase n=1 Tax=Paenibacillus oceani TaxID=2772510 RepID=A0A927C7I8_9BACL|nr:sugar phosphate isomerase/epimerase family protein [Paenibacillus oceani]MBD2862299.1 sugar phosphate isomerase/epimerase [Paenibacillus oceani]
MGTMEERRSGEAVVHPADWLIGASLSLNDWDMGRVDVAEIVQAGIRCIELAWRNDTFDMFDPVQEAKCTRWIGQAIEHGIAIRSLHLPYGPLFDVSATGDGESEAAVLRHVRLMRLARQWAIGIVILHPSYEPIRDEERPARMAACKAALASLAAEADRLGVRIAVENLPRTCLGRDSSEMSELAAADPRLLVCCDVNHMLLESQEMFIGKLGVRIGAVHMSDYDGVDERHWMPGRGVIRWNEVLRSLAKHGYPGPFLFEVRQPVPTELAACWQELLADYQKESVSERAPG